MTWRPPSRAQAAALLGGAAAGVVVAHPLGIADPLDVIDGDVQLFTQSTGTRRAADAASSPLAVAGHKHHGHVGDGRLRLHVRLDSGACGRPLPQVTVVGAGLTTRAAPRRPRNLSKIPNEALS